MKCKRCGEPEDRIHGFCSIRCEELFELEAEVQRLRESHTCETCQNPLAARTNAEIIDRLRAENERLREALAIFCNENNWTLNWDVEISWYEWCGEVDPVLTATEALNPPEQP